MFWNIGCLDYSELANIRFIDVKGEYIAKRTEKRKVVVDYWIKR